MLVSENNAYDCTTTREQHTPPLEALKFSKSPGSVNVYYFRAKVFNLEN